MARLAVVGTGYVGLVTGACLADAGSQVTCQDIQPARIEALERGEVPFHEPGLADVIARARKAGNLHFTTDFKVAAKDAKVAIVAVGTPQGKDGSADLRALNAVVDGIAKDGPKGLIVVIRSTVPPGTGDSVQERFRAAGRSDIEVVNAPEFLAEGTAVRDFQSPDRLVFGGSPKAAGFVASLWAGIKPSAPRHLVDRRTAEVCKYAANTFLAARVSLINEVANLCDAVGADVREVARIVGEDVRVGPNFLRPGIGYGGSCFPKDVQAITAVARQHNLHMPVAEATETTNHSQWKRIEAKVDSRLGSVNGKTIALLGIAFKPDTDDTRDGPGLVLAKALAQRGAHVRMHDPIAKLPADLAVAGITQAPDAKAAITGADLVVQVTEWKHYRELDWAALGAVAKRRDLIDARNALPWDKLVAAGWTVDGVGARPSLPSQKVTA